MRRPRVFLAADGAEGERLVLPEAARHHLLRVLRLGAGQRAVGVAPDGAELELELLEGGHARVVGRRLPQVEPALAVTLALGVPRGARMDWAVEKAAEIGAAAIRPVLAERAVRGDAGVERVERWRRLARAAAEQSGRVRVPDLLPPSPLGPALDGFSGPCLIAYPDARCTVAEAVGAWPAGTAAALIAVGPEGGWSAEDLRAARSVGATGVALGPRILRVETAALVALALVLAAAGDLGCCRRPENA